MNNEEKILSTMRVYEDAIEENTKLRKQIDTLREERLKLQEERHRELRHKWRQMRQRVARA